MIDYAHEQTDKLIFKLEKKIAAEYRKAAEEAQKKLDDYLRRFEVKDEKWRLMVARGEKTAAEYAEWRKGQIIVGKRWEELRDQLAKDYHKANITARKIITSQMPEAYALNMNYSTYLVEKQGNVNTGFALYSRDSVRRILMDNPDLLPPPGKNVAARIAAGKDVAWQEGHIQSLTLQSIVQGDSIPNMSKRIALEMGETNNASAIRYARTAMTEAQNAGRQNAYRRAEKLGVDMKRMWIATLDNRTRHEHRILDGQERGVDEPFEVDGYDIMYPGDPSAEGFLIWNCRCSTRAVVSGWDRKSVALRSDEEIGRMSYEEWQKSKPSYEHITKQEEQGAAARRKYIHELYGGEI